MKSEAAQNVDNPRFPNLSFFYLSFNTHLLLKDVLYSLHQLCPRGLPYFMQILLLEVLFLKLRTKQVHFQKKKFVGFAFEKIEIE